MSAGHRHRHVRVSRNGTIHRLLRGITIHRTTSREQAEASRFVYGPDEARPGAYRISLLGLLHGLTGLTLEVSDE